MKILIISSFLLFKQTRFGGSKRLFYFADLLSKVANVDLICLDACNEFETFEKPEGFSSVYSVRRKQNRNFLNRFLYLDTGLNSNFDEDIRSVLNYLKDKKYDAVLCAFPFVLSFIPYIINLNKKITYLEDDLFFEQYRKFIKESKPLSIKWMMKQYKLFHLKKFYKKHIKYVKKIICISEQEKMIIETNFPHCDVYILKYGINSSDFPPVIKKDVKTLGFIGNYKHPPNEDAIRYYFDKIFPILDRKYVTLIAGKNIPKDLQKYFNMENSICFMENPNTIEDFYDKIDIFINPIITGRGLRTKLIEAAFFAKPIISTSLGAEGVEDLKVFKADSPEEFITCIENLALDKEMLNCTIDYNRLIIKTNYSIDQIGKDLLKILKL